VQQRAVERVGERLDAERAQQRVRGRIAVGRVVPEHGAEAARVVEPQHAVGEDQVDVVVRAQRRVAARPGDRAGHAEVHHQPPVVEREQQVLAAALDRAQRAAGEPRVQVLGDRPAQRGRAQHDRLDDAPRRGRGEARSDHFDLGEFGHRVGGVTGRNRPPDGRCEAPDSVARQCNPA
jgi:hypothetical protein